LPRLPWRAWALLDPAYLAHNLMLAELVVRVLRRAPDVQFGGEWAATVSEAKKVSTGKGTRTIPRPILRPDGFFRFPGGRLYLVEVERARRYDFRRILEKARRYARVRERRPDLWKGRWGVETFPPVLVLALDAERHVARLRKEARGNRVGFLFRAWAEFLQGDDPLAGWRSWRDGTVVAVGAG
ncbi:MAG: replication-relaxation family protein, partial [Anaerolineae bacterium]